jgi:hypothetical protein
MAGRLLEILAPLSAIISIAVIGMLPDATPPPARDWPALPALENLALDEISAGESLHWRDDTLGFEATVTAEAPYLDEQGRVCRVILRTIQAAEDEEARSSRIRACRDGDGAWGAAAAPAETPRSWAGFGRLFSRQDSQIAETVE